MKVEYAPEARDDLRKLDNPKRIQVLKAIEKISKNPLPFTEGGYGKPLGSKGNRNLAGLLKIKVSDIRIVYTIKKIASVMYVLVIAARADEEVYDIAADRKE